MQKKSSKKPITILIVIVVLGALVYFYMNSNSGSATLGTADATASPEAQAAAIEGQRVLALLNQINSLRLDKTEVSSLFDDQTYKSLVDHTVEVPEQNVGRPNPFAPVGGGTVTSPATKTTSKTPAP